MEKESWSKRMAAQCAAEEVAKAEGKRRRSGSNLMALGLVTATKPKECATWLEQFLTPHARPLHEVMAASLHAGFSAQDMQAARALLPHVRDGLAMRVPHWWIGRGDWRQWSYPDADESY